MSHIIPENDIIESNLDLVDKEARKYLGKGLSYDELYQEGALGLVKAVKLNHVSKRDDMAHWISLSIITALKSQPLYIRHPERFIFDHTVNEYGETFMNTIERGDEIDVFDCVALEILREVVVNVIDTLTPCEENLLKLCFGLDGMPCVNVKDIAEIINAPQYAVLEAKRKALRKMRHPSRIRHVRGFIDGEYHCFYGYNIYENIMCDTQQKQRLIPKAFFEELFVLRSDIVLELFPPKEHKRRKIYEFENCFNISNNTLRILYVKIERCSLFKENLNWMAKNHDISSRKYIFPGETITVKRTWTTSECKHTSLEVDDRLTIVLEQEEFDTSEFAEKIYYWQFLLRRDNKNNKYWKVNDYYEEELY